MAINLEDEIAKTLSLEISEEVDWGIICSLYKEIGWTEINLEWPSMTQSATVKIKHWCRENMSGHYKARGRTWLFEHEKDAVLFALRWVNV